METTLSYPKAITFSLLLWAAASDQRFLDKQGQNLRVATTRITFQDTEKV